MHTAEPPMSESSAFEVDMAIEKLKGLKIRKNYRRSGGSLSLYVSIRWVIKQIV
jgi:hypothetical protein